jgi:hypothetical protein
MKKLLVLLMVLGLVPSAQAALSLSLDGNPAPAAITIAVSTTVLIDVHSDNQDNWNGFLGIWDLDKEFGADSTYGEWVGGITATGIGNVGKCPPLTDYYWELWVGSTNIPTDVVAGQQFAVVFRCKGVGDTSVLLTDADTVPIQTLIIHQIPEPMTIGLLGLGGLFLRRRR